MIRRYLFHIIAILGFVFVATSFATGSSPFELKEADFETARITKRNDTTVVSAKLSAIGLQKVKQLNETLVGKDIGIEVAGVRTHFKLRERIKGSEIEMGPYSSADGERIVQKINQN